MLKIGIIGHKEVPSYNGGIEAVLTEMIPLFNKEDIELTIYNRWTTFYNLKEWGEKKRYEGFRIVRIPTFKKSFLNAFVYSALASIHAMFSPYDIVHYHAEGPSTMCILPKLTGKKIVCTNHGLDWNRSKWGGFATRYLKLGEKMSVYKSDALIVLSGTIANYFKDKYNKDTIIIRNGIKTNDLVNANLIIKELGLDKNSYYLALGRIVPEKGLHYLIPAYSRLDTDIKLVIAGELTQSEYCLKLMEQAKGNDNIIFTGFVGGELKQELFSNAFAYVLPSELEGMSISLLEALSYGCNVIASNIPENRYIYDNQITFFESENIDSLVKVLESIQPLTKEEKDKQIEFIRNHYNWSQVVKKTMEVYRKVTHNEK